MRRKQICEIIGKAEGNDMLSGDIGSPWSFRFMPFFALGGPFRISHIKDPQVWSCGSGWRYILMMFSGAMAGNRHDCGESSSTDLAGKGTLWLFFTPAGNHCQFFNTEFLAHHFFIHHFFILLILVFNLFIQVYFLVFIWKIFVCLLSSWQIDIRFTILTSMHVFEILWNRFLVCVISFSFLTVFLRWLIKELIWIWFVRLRDMLPRRLPCKITPLIARRRVRMWKSMNQHWISDRFRYCMQKVYASVCKRRLEECY